MSHPWITRLTCGIVFAAGLALVLTRSEAPEVQAKEGEPTIKMDATLKANMDYLSLKLSKEPERREIPRIHGVAMILAQQAQTAGNGALRDQAIKVAEAVAKADFAAAKTAADGLATAKGDAGKPVDLAKTANVDLSIIMSVFSLDRVGGLNIEKDINTAMKDPSDKATLIRVAQNCVAIGEFTKHLPGEEVKSADDKKAWDEFTTNMIKISHEIATEAAKGDKADDEMLKKKLLDLDDSCYNCHDKFRD